MEDESKLFSDFQLSAGILEGLSAMGFSEPTPIQKQAIPAILEGKDMIACAQTGTGKTAAYLLPIIDKISRESDEHELNTIIIAPTRELALQIDQQIEGLAYFTPISSFPLYGGGSGADFDKERVALRSGTNIIVATPGKLIQHLNMGYVKTSTLKHLVLDEADRMLDMGFLQDIMKIVSHLPTERQTLLFSATMPPKIRQLAGKILQNPFEINIAISRTAEGVHQAAYSVEENQKEALLQQVLKREGLDSVIVFSSRKSSVRDIEKALQRKGFKAKSISSDLEQNEREEVLRQFRNRNYPILVATDVISRGIDIADLDMVVNYDVPRDAEDYVHRVGRTARAKSTGEAITFVSPKEQGSFFKIERLTQQEIDKPALPKDIGEAPVWRTASSTREKSGERRTFKGKSKKRSSGAGHHHTGGGHHHSGGHHQKGPKSESGQGSARPKRRNVIGNNKNTE